MRFYVRCCLCLISMLHNADSRTKLGVSRQRYKSVHLGSCFRLLRLADENFFHWRTSVVCVRIRQNVTRPKDPDPSHHSLRTRIRQVIFVFVNQIQDTKFYYVAKCAVVGSYAECTRYYVLKTL